MLDAKVYDAITIADEILKIAKKAGKALTPMQVVKLTYIAHGWSLGVGRGDLFQNRIEAWKYGPVIPDLYYVTKHYGRTPIPLNLISEADIGVDDKTQGFLATVFERYGKYTGPELSYLTHMPGTPWEKVYQDGVQHIEIPDSLIKEHYKKIGDEQWPAIKELYKGIGDEQRNVA